jgi:hypothetical protein
MRKRNIGIRFVTDTFKNDLLIFYMMKNLMITLILVALFTAGATVRAQENQDDRLGLPGDNLNLYAVMKLFQESKTLEGFERRLNDENSRINNLDLNGDNLVDYIKVNDYVDGDVHNIVLQVAVNERENQDVAVFTVQRFSDGQVFIQLTGDEELYGRDYIVEPIFDDEAQNLTPNPGYTGGGQNIIITRSSPVIIASWPVIRFIYAPRYVVWHSSWNWGYYPPYWQPWRPLYWHYYYGYHYNWYNDYYGHYRRWHTHRYTHWNDSYFNSRRSYSTNVYSRIQSGNYRNTYSHPEQRREGEAMFARMHPKQSRRSSDNSSVNNQVRRSGSQSTRSTNSSVTRTNTTRRSATTVTNKRVTNPSSDQKTVISRRSTTSVNKTYVPKTTHGKNIGTSRTSRQSKTGISSSNRRSNKATKDVTTVKNNKGRKSTGTKKDDSRK